MAADTGSEKQSAHAGYPKHIGIIMDGNGRWATKRSLPRTAGHYEGLKAAKRVTSEAVRLGIPYITYYAFSTENWKRPEQEVSYLMGLIATKLLNEYDYYRQNDLRILVRGNIAVLPQAAREALLATEESTRNHGGTTAIIAVNYGGQDEIVRSVNKWLENRSDHTPITSKDICDNLDLPSVPPPDLIIRSANEKRLSNFLLWQSAYAELAFYDTLWPDWGAKDLQTACEDFATRVRRYGGIPT
ncbi:MAG: polyprenyl diphosphate synthase [Sphaerochaetaceae bacterium]